MNKNPTYEELQDDILKLKQKENEFQSTLENLPIGVIVHAADTSIILSNSKAHNILGLTKEQIEGKTAIDPAWKFVYTDKSPMKVEDFPVNIVLSTKAPLNNYIVGLIKPDLDHITWASVNALPEFDSKGNITKIVINFIDITEQKEAAKAQRESEEKFRLLYTAMDQGLALHEIITDEHGNPIDYVFLEINDSYTRLLGVTREMSIGKRIKEVMPNVEQYWIDIFGKVALTGESSYYENYLETTGKYYSTYSYSPKKNQFAVLVTDITERRQAEEALRKSESIKNKIVSNIGDVIVIIDKNGINQYKSPNITQLFGWTPDELVGKSTWDNVHPDDLEAGQKFISTLVKEPNSIGTMELRYKRKDGKYVWIKITVMNLLHDQDIQGLLGNYHEITERKKTQQQLIEAKEKAEENEKAYKNLVETTSDLISVVDNQGTFIFINHASTKFFGLLPHECLNKNAFDFIHPEDLEETKSNFKTWLNSDEDRFYFENRQIDIHGNIKNVAWNIYIEKNSDYFRVTSVARDITESKKLEETLRKSEEHYRLINNASFDQIYSYDLENRFTSANRVLCENLNLSAEQIIGKTYWELGFSEELCKGWDELHRQAYITGSKTETVTTTMPDGSIQYFEVNLAVLKDSNGVVIGLTGVNRNVTEREFAKQEILKAKEKAEQSEITFRKLFEDSSDPILLINDKNVFVECNQAALDLLKMSREQFLFMSPANISPEYQSNGRKSDELASEIIKLAHKNGLYRFDWTHLNTNGDEFIVEVSLVPIIFEGKTMLHTTWRDITERKLVEIELKKAKVKAEQSELYLKETRSIAQLGTYTFDITTGNWTSSKILDNIFGIDENYDKSIDGWVSIIHPDWQEIMNNYFAEEVIGKKLRFDKEYKIIRKSDNEVRWVHGLGKLEYNEDLQPIKMLGTIKDISERKQTEEELLEAKEKAEQNEQRLQLATASDKLGIWDWDVKDNSMYWDERMFELYGISNNTFSSNVDGWTNGLHPEDKERALSECYAALKGEKEFDTIFKVLHPNGKIIYLKANAIVIRDNNGDAIRMIGINKDVTTIINTENELIKSKEKAEESDNLKSAFLANMSHEIRTPMNAILGFSSLLKNKELTDDKKEKYIEFIESGGKRLLTLINDIVDISKIDANQLSINVNVCNLNELIENLRSQFTLQLNNTEVDLISKTALPNNKSYIKTDDVRLGQILSNLLENAIKFTTLGHIEFGYTIQGSLLQFYVKDTGIGIDCKNHEAIFDRFRQVDNEYSRSGSGTGLGLSIVKGLVKLLGGTIWVESELEKGAVFYFNIPYIKEETTIYTEEIDGIQDIISDNKTTILVAEDEISNYMYIEALLEDYQCTIIHAKNGKEAVEIASNNNSIDLILMDIKMPVMNGFEATKEIRSINKTIPIIAQTAYAMAGDKQKSIEIGCNDYISKPIARELLAEILKKYLKKGANNL